MLSFFIQSDSIARYERHVQMLCCYKQDQAGPTQSELQLRGVTEKEDCTLYLAEIRLYLAA